MSADDDYEAKVLALIAEALPKKAKHAKLEETTRLWRDLGIDSIAMLAILFRFEQTFGVDLAEVDLAASLEQMKTVGDALSLGRRVLEKARAKSV